MDTTADLGFPSALELVQRSLEQLRRKRRTEGLRPVDEVRYRNLLELQNALFEREAS